MSTDFATEPSYNVYKTVNWSTSKCDQIGR